MSREDLLHGSHKRKSRRSKSVRRNEGSFTEEAELIDEKKARSHVSANFSSSHELQDLKMKLHGKFVHLKMRTTAMLEEKRRGMINHTTYELNTQENKAANTVQHVEQQWRQQYVELPSRNYDYERLRTGQLRLLADYETEKKVIKLYSLMCDMEGSDHLKGVSVTTIVEWSGGGCARCLMWLLMCDEVCAALDMQSAGYLERVMATTTVYPRLS